MTLIMQQRIAGKFVNSCKNVVLEGYISKKAPPYEVGVSYGGVDGSASGGHFFPFASIILQVQ
jgi:hypothetical protein